MDSFRFSEALASRLCHDLVTPLGAIHTGLELLSETPPSHCTEFQEILNLILQSTVTASSRTRFFRAAFGKSGETSSFADLHDLVQAYFASSKIKIDWEFGEEAFPQGSGRLLLNALLWLGECAPQGGEISLVCQKDPISFFRFSLRADPILLHEGMAEALSGQKEGTDCTPRTVPGVLLRHLVIEKGGKLVLHHTPSSHEMTLEIVF